MIDPRDFVFWCGAPASVISVLLVALGRREGFLLGVLGHSFWLVFFLLDERPKNAGLAALLALVYLFGYVRRRPRADLVRRGRA